MNKLVHSLIVMAMAAFLIGGGTADALEVHVSLAPQTRSYAPPPLGRRQGWLTVTNRDWKTYTLVQTGNDRLYLYDVAAAGGIAIPSGATVTLALERDTYDLYGANSERLRVRVREGRTTSLDLEPIGYVGRTGLRAIVNDGDRVRDAVLFDVYSAPVIIQRPPVIIENRPPPPPVIINRPPVHRPNHRPPPPPPPSHNRPGPNRPGPGGPGRPGGPGGPGHRPPEKKDSWGFVFGFGR
ncbi:MAG: hypothetical protein LIP23_04590 [Planctomycetes bacterium]|nr:hypothetical protein [Planctomycetota bacterium]